MSNLLNAVKEKLTEGETVSIKIGAYPDKRFSGIVESISSDTSNNKTAVQIRMTNENGLLRAGMQAEIDLD